MIVASMYIRRRTAEAAVGVLHDSLVNGVVGTHLSEVAVDARRA